MAPQFRYLDELHPHGDYEIRAGICRKWDSYNLYGTYLSTDYLLADSKENVIHCTTKNKVAHMFIDKLMEGSVYSFRQFKVLPSPTTFPLTTNRHMLELHGTSMVKQIDDPAPGFPRYAFNLTPIQGIKFEAEGRLIDVAGYVTDVGQIVAREIGRGKKQQKITQALDFYLLSIDGFKVRITLWGDLCNLMLQKRPSTDTAYPLLLVGMQVKSYNDTYLSSTSATIMYDDPEIPVLSLFARDKPRHEAIQVPPTQLTLRQLSEWCQAKKKAAIFHCSARIKEVNTEKPWYYFSCASAKCKKGVTRRDGKFYCESCKENVAFPKPRFRVQLKVEDHTHSTWITLFDDTAEELFNSSVESLLRSQRVSETGELPTILLNMIGTTHILEIPSQSYFPHGGENYTCIGITPASEISSQVSPSVFLNTIQPNGAERSNEGLPPAPAVGTVSQEGDGSNSIAAAVAVDDGSPRDVASLKDSQESADTDEEADGGSTQKKGRKRPNGDVADGSSEGHVSDEERNGETTQASNRRKPRVVVFSDDDQ